MSRFTKLLAATLIFTAAAAASANARQAWYGPGSGRNPYAKNTVTTQQRPGTTTQTFAKPQTNCVAGSRCFNGYLDGHLPSKYQKASGPVAPPHNCVAGSRCFNGYLDGHIPTRP